MMSQSRCISDELFLEHPTAGPQVSPLSRRKEKRSGDQGQVADVANTSNCNSVRHWNILKASVKSRHQQRERRESFSEDMGRRFRFKNSSLRVNGQRSRSQGSSGLQKTLQEASAVVANTMIDQDSSSQHRMVPSHLPDVTSIRKTTEVENDDDEEEKDTDDGSVVSDACSSITHGSNDFASHNCTFDMADTEDGNGMGVGDAGKEARISLPRRMMNGKNTRERQRNNKDFETPASNRRLRPEMPGRMASLLYQAQASARTIVMKGGVATDDKNAPIKACAISHHHAVKQSRPFLAFELMNFAAEARRSSKRLMFQKGKSHYDVNNSSSFSFGQCHVLSMSPTTIINAADDPWKLLDHGARQMDTFIMETSAEVIYKYPAVPNQKANNLSPEVLSSFCFPYGVSVRLVPRSVLDGARSIGWVGPNADKYQLKAFTNESGDITHGICVSVRELFHSVSDSDQEQLIKCLQDRLRMRRAARRICSLWRERTREKVAFKAEEERQQRRMEQEERRAQLARHGRSMFSSFLQNASKRFTTSSSRNISSSLESDYDVDVNEFLLSSSIGDGVGDETLNNDTSPPTSPSNKSTALIACDVQGRRPSGAKNSAIGAGIRRRSLGLLGFDICRHSRDEDESFDDGGNESEDEPTPTRTPSAEQRSASVICDESPRSLRRSFGFSRQSFGRKQVSGGSPIGGKKSPRSKSVGDWPSPEQDCSQLDNNKVPKSSLSSAVATAAELIDAYDDNNNKDVNSSGSLDGSIDDSLRTRQSLIMTTVSECHHEENDGEKVYPEHVIRAAKEAYAAMKESDNLGYAVIVQKCFVLTDVQDGQQALLFCALQQMINREREARKDEGYQVELTSAEEERDALFDYMQKNLRLTYRHSRIPDPSNNYDAVSKDRTRYAFSFQLPGKDLESKMVPLPLPNVTAEWGLGRFLLTIKQKSLMDLMRLLLLEQSVLVIGKRPDQVTCCTSALLELLKPFKWAGAFIPFIRQDMLEFVTAPVPFIAGMTTETVKCIDNIKSDAFIQEAMNYGLSIVDLYRGELYITSCPAVKDVIESFDKVPHDKLEHFQKRIDDLSQNEQSTLHCFNSFVERGFSPRERLTIHAIRDTIRQNLENLMCVPTNDRSRWEAYGTIDPISNEFDFDQESFMEPERLHMLSQVQFKEMATKTQIFLGYVEEQCRAAKRQKDLLKGMEAMVIAHWLGRHWKMYKERTREQGEKGELVVL